MQTGMPGIKLSRGTGDSLAAVSMVMPDDEVLLGSENGKIVRLQASAIEVRLCVCFCLPVCLFALCFDAFLAFLSLDLIRVSDDLLSTALRHSDQSTETHNSDCP